MDLLTYKEIFINDTLHYQKPGLIRTYKKLMQITNDEDVAKKIMIRHLGFDPLEVKYLARRINYRKRRYLKSKYSPQ